MAKEKEKEKQEKKVTQELPSKDTIMKTFGMTTISYKRFQDVPTGVVTDFGKPVISRGEVFIYEDALYPDITLDEARIVEQVFDDVNWKPYGKDYYATSLKHGDGCRRVRITLDSYQKLRSGDAK